MTRLDCSRLVSARDADAERTRVQALWQARKRFRMYDADVTAIGRMLRDLRGGESERRWRLWQ